MLFRDRVDAGRQLAARLSSYRGHDVVVYALPRGGVVLGAEVAQALDAPLDVIIARKVGHPFNPEYALCAITESGGMVCNEAERAMVDPQWFAQAVEHERQEAHRRRERYFAGRAPVPVEGKIAILVDDGIATGLTMRAGIDAVRKCNAREIVVAVPVIPKETAELLTHEVDRVVAVDIPDFFMGAVGAYYDDFRQVTDEEVIALLQEGSHGQDARATDPVLLFSQRMYKSLAELLLPFPHIFPGEYSLLRFPNDEMQVSLETGVIGEPCIVLGTIMPPDDHLLETLLLCHTLKKERASRVSALLPYFAYMRQDKDEPAKSLAAKWVGALLQASGVDEVVTLDIHSPLAVDILPIPVTSLLPAGVFAQEIRTLGWESATVVAPDAGSVPRCEAVQHAAGITTPLAIVRKQRTPEGVHSTLTGEVGRRAVIIDDILDTGGTLIACCELLRQAGVQEIVVMVTHGLFTGHKWERLWELGVVRLYCTDTVPLPREARFEDVTVLSIAPVLVDYLGGLAT